MTGWKRAVNISAYPILHTMHDHCKELTYIFASFLFLCPGMSTAQIKGWLEEISWIFNRLSGWNKDAAGGFFWNRLAVTIILFVI